MTTEPRDPRVREVMFELLRAAPPPPPLRDAVATSEEPHRRGPGRPTRLAAAILVVLVVIAGAIVVVAGRSPSKRTPIFEPTISGPSIRPDVAFIDRRGLVVRAAASDHDVVVATGTISGPRWSPSGARLAYRIGAALWVVNADGTHRQQIANLADTYFDDAYAWSPTVDALGVVTKTGVQVWWYDGDQPQELLLTPPVGGVEHRAQEVAWSQGGTSLAISMLRYTHTGPGAPEASLWLATHVCSGAQPVSCGAPDQLQRLPYRPRADDYPVFLAGFAFDNRYVLIWPDYQGSGSVALDGLPLQAVPIDGGPVVTIAGTLTRRSWVRSSADGSGLVLVRSNGRMVTDNREVDVCDAPSRCRALAPEPDGQSLDPAWSPDGRRVSFVREPNDNSAPPPDQNGNVDWTIKYRTRKLWIANADGSDAHELPAAGAGVADPVFAPDGNSIVFVRDARVWQLDLASDGVSALSGSMRAAATCASDPECLPDGAVYETNALWSDHEAVHFAPVAPTPVTTPGSEP